MTHVEESAGCLPPGPVHESERGCGPLREREDALALLAREAGHARRGAGRLVLFKGATGTGRTSLLEAAAEEGTGQGMRVLKVRCSAENTGAAYAAVLQLLDPCSELGADPAPDAGPDEPPDPARQRRFTGRLWQLLCSYTGDSPLLLAVDDVHLADPSSRRWFTGIARRLDELPVLLVATERSQYDIAPSAPGLAHALSPSLVRTRTLAPLSRTTVEELVRAWGGDRVGDAWVDGCVRAGAGNPLLLRALLDDLRTPARAGAAAAALPDSHADLYPGAYAAAVSWWLDSAGPRTAAVARTLAELEDGHDAGELLAAVAGADPARVSGWVTAMERLGILRRDPVRGQPRFAHGLLHGAVLDGWPRSARQATHRAAARLRYRRGDRAEAVAGHLLQAPPVGAEWAAEVLLDAAPTAVGAGRTADAVDYLRRALDEPMSRSRRAATLGDLGSLEFATVQSAGISRLAEALRLHEQPEDRVRTAISMSTALASQGEAQAALAVLRGLGGSVRDDPGLSRAVQTASALLSDHDREIRQQVYSGLRDEQERSPVALGPAEQALVVRFEATAGLVSAGRAMERIRTLLTVPEDPLVKPYLLGTAATVAQWADELDEADRLVRRGLAEQSLLRLHPMHLALLNTRADTALARDRFPELLAEPGVWELPADRGAGSGPTNLQANALLALVETDRLPEARRLAGRIGTADAHDSWELNRFLYARGVLRAASADHLGALDDLLECGRLQTARDVVSPVVTPWRSAAAECYLALGRPQPAIALAEEEHRLAAVWDTPRVLGRALRTLGAVTGGQRGLELSAQAVDTLRGAPAGTELVRALLARGRQLTAAGQWGQARPLLQEAAAVAEQAGAARLLAGAERALREGGTRRTGAGHAGPAELTDSEYRIAALAAEGRTNAEIAELLQLALRTVETHLTNAYRKLGIRRRTGLPAALDRSGSRGSARAAARGASRG